MNAKPERHPLNEENLRKLTRGVQIPAHNRRQSSVSLVRIGVGDFHRAHQAIYLDDRLSSGAATWSECGIGLLSQ